MILVFSVAMNIHGLKTGKEKQGIYIPTTSMEEGIFLGSGMSGVVITLSPGQSGSDLGQYVSHLDGGQGGVEALVSALGTSPFNGLFDVVGSEHPVDHRNAGIEANGSNPF